MSCFRALGVLPLPICTHWMQWKGNILQLLHTKMPSSKLRWKAQFASKREHQQEIQKEHIVSLDPIQFNKEVWCPIEIQNVYDHVV